MKDNDFDIFFNEYPHCAYKSRDKDLAKANFKNLSPDKNLLDFIISRIRDEKEARKFAKDNDIFYAIPVSPSEYLKKEMFYLETPSKKELLESKIKSELSEDSIRASDVSQKEKEALTFILRVSEIEQAVFFRENPNCIYRSGAGFKVAITWLNAWESYTVDDMKEVIKQLSVRTEGEPFSRTLSLKSLNAMLKKAKEKRVAPEYIPIYSTSAVDDELERLKSNGLYYEMEKKMKEEKSAVKKLKIYMNYKKKLDPTIGDLDQKAINMAVAIDKARSIN